MTTRKVGKDQEYRSARQVTLSHDQYSKSKAMTQEKKNEKSILAEPLRSVDGPLLGEVEIVAEGGLERNLAKYAVLATTSKPDHISNLLTKEWQIDYPKLLISITGEGYGLNDREKKRKITTALETVVKEAVWFVTDGAESEISKVIGHVVENEDINTRPTIIGIATAEYLKGKDALEQGATGQGVHSSSENMYLEYFTAQVKRTSGDYCLNPFCTHFLLTVKATMTIDGKPQTVSTAKFRVELEEYIRQMTNDKNILKTTTPGLLLVAGGDNFQSSSMIKRYLDLDLPVVVLKGSGGFADFLYRIRNDTDVSPTSIEIFSETEKDMEHIITQRIRVILKHTNWKSVTFVDLEDETCRLDVAMLDSLISKTQDVKSKFHLALLFNSANKVNEYLFSNATLTAYLMEDMSLSDNMLRMALMKGNADFVQLLLKECVDLKSFLNNNLANLLVDHQSPELNSNQVAHKQMRRTQDIGYYDQVEWMGRDSRPTKCGKEDVDEENQRYCWKPKSNSKDPVEDMRRYVVKKLRLDVFSTMHGVGDNKYKQDDPYFDLLIWSILNYHQNLAKFAWQHCQEPIPSALLASGLCRRIRKQLTDTDELFARKILSNEKEFSNLAMNVLTQCFDENPDKTAKLLTIKRERWRNHSCLDLAYNLKNKTFMSSDACIPPLTVAWFKNIAPDNTAIQFFLSPIFMGLFVLGYNKDRKYYAQTRCERIRNRITTFYTSPIMKFIHTMVSYIVFLGVFAYSLLSGFRSTPSTLEYVLIVWVFAFAVEEIIEGLRQRSNAKKAYGPHFDEYRQMSLILYFKDSWNYFDCTTIIFASIGLSLIYIDNYSLREVARVFLVISFIAFCLRILKAFSALEELGPQVYMISRMAKDLMYFAIILLVFIISYAVSSYSLLYPQSDFNIDLVLNVMRLGYWNMYAELMLEEIEIKEPSCTFEYALYSNGTLPRCPVQHRRQMALVLMGIYLLFSNVLLLNILIAMFADTYRRIMDRKDNHWNFQRYALVREFERATIIPIPVLGSLITIIGFLCKCSRRKNTVTHMTRKKAETWRRIKHFEREMTYTLTKRMAEEEKELKLTHGTISKLISSSIDKKFKRLDSLRQTSQSS